MSNAAYSFAQNEARFAPEAELRERLAKALYDFRSWQEDLEEALACEYPSADPLDDVKELLDDVKWLLDDVKEVEKERDPILWTCPSSGLPRRLWHPRALLAIRRRVDTGGGKNVTSRAELFVAPAVTQRPRGPSEMAEEKKPKIDLKTRLQKMGGQVSTADGQLKVAA